MCIRDSFLGPVVTFRKDSIVRSVVAQSEKKRVRHVRLQSQRLRTIDHYEQLGHMLPAVHTSPANLAFRGEPFSEAIGNRTCFSKSLSDALRVSDRIF